MAHRIQFSRAWCDDHLAQCYYSHDESTGVNQHVGTSADFGRQVAQLQARGYVGSHKGGGVFVYTLYKAAPLALPLEWQIVASKEPEYIQDW